ncbi:MAG: outer membrane beta-barrel protein [Candidatus Aminicenantales bacterium]
MKRLLALVFVVMFAVTAPVATFAPKSYGADFKFLIGVNSSTVHEHSYLDLRPESKGGFLLGGGAEFNLSKNISFELNGLYFQKRYTQIVDAWTEESRIIAFTVHEINLPILVKFKRLFRSPFYLFGGGELAYIASGALIYKFDYGAVAGGGIELERLIPFSSIEVRFRLGIKAITIAFILAFSLVSGN